MLVNSETKNQGIILPYEREQKTDTKINTFPEFYYFSRRLSAQCFPSIVVSCPSISNKLLFGGTVDRHKLFWLLMTIFCTSFFTIIYIIYHYTIQKWLNELPYTSRCFLINFVLFSVFGGSIVATKHWK